MFARPIATRKFRFRVRTLLLLTLLVALGATGWRDYREARLARIAKITSAVQELEIALENWKDVHTQYRQGERNQRGARISQVDESVARAQYFVKRKAYDRLVGRDL